MSAIGASAPRIDIFRKPIQDLILNFTQPCCNRLESSGAPTDPLALLNQHAEEDLRVPGKNDSLNYKIVLFCKVCQNFFDIMVTGFSFSVVKLKNLSMCILNLLKNMRNFGLIQFCWLNSMDI